MGRRWEIEGYYRDEKVVMEIEKFHTKTINGILQELYAAIIRSIDDQLKLTVLSPTRGEGVSKAGSRSNICHYLPKIRYNEFKTYN